MKRTSDICQLTGSKGKFVKAHIIPKGLMPKIRKDEPFIQLLENGRRRKLHHGLYGSKIVTRQGEDLLAELDSWAIDELRANKLVWNGWGNNLSLTETDNITFLGSHKNFGRRETPCRDTKKLRRFFLSLLWRAAVSNLPELQEIDIPEKDVNTIGKIISSRTDDPVGFYPIVLTQLNTREADDTHLSLPEKDFLEIEGHNVKIPFYRFYFDGLIIHLYDTHNSNSHKSFGALEIGSSANIKLVVRRYESSREYEESKKALERITQSELKN